MPARFTTRQIAEEAYVVLDEGIIIGAVWKAPDPFRDWYWGRVRITQGTYDMVACGAEDQKADAINACCLESNRQYLVLSK